MAYKKPNVKKRRVKAKSLRVMNESVLREFKEQHPEHKDITLTEFNAIVKKFNTNIVNYMNKNIHSSI